MTNKLAIILFALIVTLFIVDRTVIHLNLPLIAAKGLDNFIEYVSFWR